MTTTLTQLMDDKSTWLTNSDPTWVKFLEDHLNIISTSAKKISISLADADTYKYKLRRFLSSINYNTDLTWLVMILNGIHTGRDFVNVSSILLPNIDDIRDIYNDYQTTSAKILRR